MKNIFIILIYIVLFGGACSSRERQFTKEIKSLQSRTIRLPLKGLIMQLGTELQKVDVNEKGLKLVVYADSAGCTTCAIDHIDSWERFIDYAKQFNNQLRFYFIFSPMKEELHRTKLMIANTIFDYPILLDTLGEFEKLNPHLPKNRALHTFLLDENNQVVLVGNQLHNKKIEEMFYKIVEEKLGKPQ
ncbi:MAG: hypothetical protein RR346_04110 [Bacteroidales bacterium]